MIKLNQLTIKNFMSITDTVFDFSGGGFFVFKGKFGAGKSAVLAAIALCLIEYKRGDTYKEFIKQGTDEADVSLAGELLGHAITFHTTIARGRNDSSTLTRVIEYKTGDDKQTYTNSECTAFLEGLDIDYLQHIMFSMQGEGNITDLKPGDRTKLLKKIFNFEFSSEVETITKRQLETSQALTIAVTQRDLLQNRQYMPQEPRPVLSSLERAQIDLEIEALEIKSQSAYQARQAHKALVDSRDALGREVRTLANTVQGYTSQITDQTNQLTTHTATLARAKAALAAVVSEASLVTKRAALVTQAETLQDSLELVRSQIPDRTTKVHSLLSRKLTLETHVKAHAAGECAQCGQATHPEAIPQMKDELAAVVSEYATVDTALQTLNAEVRRLETALVVNVAETKAVGVEIDTAAKTRVTLTQSINLTEDAITQVKATIVLADQKKVGAQKLVDEARERYETAVAAIPPEDAPDDGASTLTNLRQRLAADLTAVEVNKAIDTANAAVEAEKLADQIRVDALLLQQNELQTYMGALKEAQKVLESDLPNFIIIKACGKIEKYINEFIQGVQPGMSVKLLASKRGVDFFYSPTSGFTDEQRLSTRMASGFEKELLSIAWRVALARAYHLPVLILDEIESAADSSASEATYRALARADDFDQIFVISHQEELANILTQEADKVALWSVVAGNFTKEF